MGILLVPFLFLLPIVALVWPVAGATMHAALVLVVEVGCVALNNLMRFPGPVSSEWTSTEAQVLRKYPVFFVSPGNGRSLSSLASGIQLSTIFWVPWCIYRRFWVLALLLAANWAAAGYVAVIMNPPHFFAKRARNNPTEFVSMEVETLLSTCEKRAAGVSIYKHD